MTKPHHPHSASPEDLEEGCSCCGSCDCEQGACACEEAAAEEMTSPAKEAAPDPAEELAQLKDQMLRAMAETENTRRRLAKEVEDARAYAVSSFAKEILTVSDNFTRALEAVPKEEAENPVLKTLVTGIEATERQLQSVLDRFGIKKIDPEGKPFDPNFHRVMMEVEDASKPAGTVLQVLQAGYMIHGRLLREALVAVSKGGAPQHTVDKSA